jgi:hypothetical protein
MRNRSGKRVLFREPAALVADTETLARVARTLYAGGAANGRFFEYYDVLEGACVAAVDALRRQELAPAVVEVAAAATVVALAKDYAVSGFVEQAELLRADRPEHAATARRVALLGAASQQGALFADARPGLAAMRGDRHAEALVAAMDVVRAGSLDAVARLDALAAARPAALSILWLVEVAARTIGDDARLRRARRALDEVLDSDAYGAGARDAATIVAVGRDDLDRDPAALAVAWRAVSTLERAPAREVDDDDDDELLAELRAKAAKGSALHERLIEAVLASRDEMADLVRQDEAAYGPFLRLRLPADLGQVLDRPSHYAVMGFRELYGIEILASALPEITALARVGRSLAN